MLLLSHIARTMLASALASAHLQLLSCIMFSERLSRNRGGLCVPSGRGRSGADQSYRKVRAVQKKYQHQPLEPFGTVVLLLSRVVLLLLLDSRSNSYSACHLNGA
jgi:hypothetical protein